MANPIRAYVVEGTGQTGFNFGVFRRLTAGYVLFGEITGVGGKPCIVIGAEDDPSVYPPGP